MNSFALFRLPYEQVVTRVVQHDRQPVAGQVFSDVYRQKGFVFAPFAVSDDCPLLLIRADEVCKCPLDELTEELLRSELGSCLSALMRSVSVPSMNLQRSCSVLN